MRHLRTLLVFLVAAAGSVAGCECGSDAPTVAEEVAAEAAAPLSAFFPLSPGDRWRLHVVPPDIERMEGVTAVDDQGRAVVFGTGHPIGERYTVSDLAASMVDEQGREAIPVLRAPLRQGARFEYALAEKDVAVPCEVEITAVGQVHRVSGIDVPDCLTLRRVCRYGAQAPFEEPTTHTTDEVFCPGVGRVREHSRFDPPPRGRTLPPERTEEVVFHRVSGGVAPAEPERFGCRSFALLPSDVQRVCPGALGRDPAAGVDGEDEESCRYGYRARGAEIAITARRFAAEPSPEELATWLREGAIAGRAVVAGEAPSGGEGDGEADAEAGADGATEVRVEDGLAILGDAYALAAGRYAVRFEAGAEACPEARRLAPTLRSLVSQWAPPTE